MARVGFKQMQNPYPSSLRPQRNIEPSNKAKAAAAKEAIKNAR
jgi:hypothetical protein